MKSGLIAQLLTLTEPLGRADTSDDGQFRSPADAPDWLASFVAQDHIGAVDFETLIRVV